MTLPSRPMHVPLGVPIDEATREEWLDVGKANRANVNVRLDERGAAFRRNGFELKPSTRLDGSTRLAGRRLLEHNGVPLVIDGTHLDAYVEVADTNATRSRVPECSYRLMGLPTSSPAGRLIDVEYCNGLVATTAWREDSFSTCMISVIDAATGAVIRAPENLVTGASQVQLASTQGFLFAFVYEAGVDITVFSLDTSDVASGWQNLASVDSSATIGSMAVCSLEDRVAVAYVFSTGIRVKTYNSGGHLETRFIDTSPSTPASPLDIQGTVADTLWVAWVLSGAPDTAYCIGLDADNLAVTLASTAAAALVTNPTASIGICAGSAPGTARMFALQESPGRLYVLGVSTSLGTAITTTPVTIYNAVPASRPFQQGGRFYMAAFAGATAWTNAGNSQGLCIVVDWTDDASYLRPIANLEPGLIARPSDICKWSPVGTTGRWVHGLQTIKAGTLDLQSLQAGNAILGFSLAELDFSTRDRWQSVSHGGNTILGGALTSIFDGARVTELGFLARPQKPTTSKAAGSLTGTFRYVVIDEDVDASGNWSVSGISDTSDLVTAAAEDVTVNSPPLSVSARVLPEDGSTEERKTRKAFYRTRDGGLPPYYRLGAVANNSTVPNVQYVDSTLDGDLETHAKLYAPNLPSTPGDSLDRRAPPGLIHLETYNGMLVGAKGESVFWSGQEVYGEATWLSPVFELPITGGGDITGIKAVDGTLYIFKRERVYAVAGEAPSDNGLSGGLGTPRLIASDVGCIEPNSLLVTSLGVFFQSDRGIEILNRGQSVEWIGEAIQRTTRQYPVLTAAVRDAKGLARFALAEQETDGVVGETGVTVVYDLSLKAWVSTDVITGNVASEAAQSAARVYMNGAWRYAWLGSDGNLYIEDDGYGDVGVFIEPIIELPRWKLGLQQEQRVYEFEMLIEARSSGGIRIEVAEDFGNYGAVTADKVWLYSDIDATTRQVSFRTREHGSCVGLRIRETEADGVGPGLAFIGISADVAPKQGGSRGTSRINPGLRR